MVAHRGYNWQLAPSLIALEAEVDAMAPGRSKRSDGSIGDAAHSARTSDHNPDNGFVDAIDITHSPPELDIHALLRQLAARGDRRIKYLISNGQIHNPSRGDPPGWWRRYTGSNPHRAHGHISVLNSGRVDTSPWFTATVPQPQPQPVPVPVPIEGDDEEVTKLIRNDPAKGGDGGVIAVNGFLRQNVPSEELATWVFVTGGLSNIANVDPAGFAFFVRNTREVDEL